MLDHWNPQQFHWNAQELKKSIRFVICCVDGHKDDCLRLLSGVLLENWKRSMSSLTTQRIYFVGHNHCCKFGLEQDMPFKELAACTNKIISKTFCGYSYNVFTDDDLDNVWVAGSNFCGQCGLKKKKLNNLNHTQKSNISKKME